MSRLRKLAKELKITDRVVFFSRLIPGHLEELARPHLFFAVWQNLSWLSGSHDEADDRLPAEGGRHH
jgi:hypothetical protein